MSGKKRLDVLLVERGLQESRQKAQAVIMSGQVFKLDLVMTSVIILGILAGVMYGAVLLLEKIITKKRLNI